MSPHAGSDRNKSICKRCLRLLKWIPVGFILAIVFWSYYSYVILLCFHSLDNDLQLVSYIIVYHMIFVMFMWAYIQTIVTPVPIPPEKFKLPPGELDRLTHADNEEMQNAILEQFSKNLAARNRTVNGGIRYCEKCKQVKPDRAHHCSVCGKCVLKMDHHCPWVNNCVCFSNYKYFILFLGYSLIYCLFISATSFEFFIMYWRGTLEGLARFHITFLFFVAVMFGISLASLFFYHIYLVSVNRTTLEAFRPPVFINGPDKNSYNLGRKANFKEVFGNKPCLWFIPVFTTIGNGVEFPMRTKNRTSYHSISRASTKTDA